MTTDLHPYPAYKDSGVPWLGEVPEHWKTYRLDRLFDLRKESPQPGDPRVTGYLDGRVTLRSNVPGQKIKGVIKDAGWQRVYPGDFAISGMNAHMGGMGVSDALGQCSPIYLILIPHQGVNPHFISHAVREQAFSGALRALVNTIRFNSADFKREDIKKVWVSIPPLPEQTTIVRFLDHIDRHIRRSIRAKQKLIKLLEEQKQAIINQAVTRGLDLNVRLKPSGVEWLGEVPEHWDVWQIGHFARVGNGSTPSRGNAAYWVNGTYPWINSGCVNQGLIQGADQFVTEKALEECHLPCVPSGSVLVAITGQGKTRGTAALLGIEATINQHIAFITPKRSVALAEYLQLTFKAAYRELRRISDDAGSTKGALTCEDISHFKVALPPLKEQGLLISAIRRE